MDYIYQHCFEDNYRNAHDRDFIRDASNTELAKIAGVLNEEFLDAATKVIKEGITEPIRKFQLYSELLVKELSDDLFSKTQAMHLQVALCTGSLLEGLLQLFLLAYKHDYVKAHWKQWENTNTDELYTLIEQNLSDLVQNNVIGGSQKNTLLELLKNELKIRKNGKEIKRIMLDELIGLCRNQKIFSESKHIPNVPKEDAESVYIEMESIRDCRNNVHIFTNQSLPSLERVLNNVRNYCLIANDVIIRVQGLIGD